MVISIADDEALFSTILLAGLPKNWQSMMAYPTLQTLGSEWYQSRQSLVLKVPSAIIPKEYNYLVNTLHPGFRDEQKISLVRTEEYFLDE
jgi:RES domain-containing protein